MAMSNKLIAAYRQTNYIIDAPDGPTVLRIGVPSVELFRMFEKLHVRSAVYITAWNPFSQMKSDLENVAENRRLRAVLESACLSVLDGRGQSDDGSWPAEASFLGLGVTRNGAMTLGRQFMQNAIVWIGEDCCPELIILA
jgi:hypothetical protein